MVTRFPQVVLDGEEVIARGRVTSLTEESGRPLADCDIWLEHADRGILLEGEARVMLPSS